MRRSAYRFPSTPPGAGMAGRRSPRTSLRRSWTSCTMRSARRGPTSWGRAIRSRACTSRMAFWRRFGCSPCRNGIPSGGTRTTAPSPSWAMTWCGSSISTRSSHCPNSSSRRIRRGTASNTRVPRPRRIRFPRRSTCTTSASQRASISIRSATCWRSAGRIAMTGFWGGRATGARRARLRRRVCGRESRRTGRVRAPRRRPRFRSLA